MSDLPQLLRTAHRRLARTPALSVGGVMCLALGIGATTATWSAVSQALLRPLPFGNSDRLVAVHRITAESGPLGEKSQSPANYADLARQTRQLESFAALTWGSAVLQLGGSPVSTGSVLVTCNFFATLRARATLGRTLTPNDEGQGAPQVAVLSNEFWRRAFGGDPSVVGRSVVINGQATQIVGVLPADFRVPDGSQMIQADVWQPLRFTPEAAAVRDNYPLETFGRLAPQATVQSAELELRGIWTNLARAYPELRGSSVRVAPLQAENVAPLKAPLALMLGAVALVLGIAVTNVSALLLARGVERRREVAVRVALGASAWDTTRDAVAESLVLVAWGLALGVVLAFAAVRTVGVLAANELPQLDGLRLDLRVLGFAVCVAVAAAALCSVAPALRASRVDPQDALRGARDAGGGREQHRALGGLVVAEVALSLVLLLGAGLVLHGFTGLLSSDPGFDASHILRLYVSVVRTDAKPGSPMDFVQPALEAIQRVPGVQAAGVISSVPFVSWGNNMPVRYRWSSQTDEGQLPAAEIRRVTPGLFDVTRQLLIAGRLLRSTDDEHSPPVYVVNEALVRRDFQGREPIGAGLYSYNRGAFGTIVGVVSDIKNYGPLAAPVPEIYSTVRQDGIGSTLPIMIRTRVADPASVLSGVRAAIAGVDPTAAISDALPMRDVIARSVGGPRFYANLLGYFAAAAVLLAIAGMYGVLSYTVSQRTRELGVRAALGGTPGRIMRLIAGEGLMLGATGAVLGAATGLAATRVMSSLLYGTSAFDPAAWVGAVLALLLVVAVATALPALRASRVAPAVVLKSE
jgi:predicted permease